MKKKSKKLKNHWLKKIVKQYKKEILVIALVGLLTFTVLSAWNARINPGPQYYQGKINTPTITPRINVDYPTPTPLDGFLEVKDFKRRQFDLGAKLLDFDHVKIDYPEEILNYKDSDLIPLSCTKTYQNSFRSEEYIYYGQGNEGNFKLTDAKLLNYANSLNERYDPRSIITISACMTENDKTFVIYGVSLGGGGDYWGAPYIGIDTGNGVSNVIENIGIGGCSVLQLVKDEFLYVECSAFEGGGGFVSVSQINLNNKTVTRLQDCRVSGQSTACN